MNNNPGFNAEALGALYGAFSAGDFEAARGFLAPDCILHVPGRGAHAGEYWGVEGFGQFMANIAARQGGLFDLRLITLAVSGEDAFSRELLRTNRARDPERIWTLPISNRFKLRGARISELWVIPEDQRLYDEYWTVSAGGNEQPRVRRPSATGDAKQFEFDKSTSYENTELLWSMYRRFWDGDMDGMRRVLAPDVVVNIVGRSALSGEYRGWDGYVAFRNRLMGIAGSKYKLDVIALAAGAHDAFAVEHIRMNRTWDPAVREVYVLMHFTVNEGIVTRMDDFPLDTYAWEGFYSGDSEAQLRIGGNVGSSRSTGDQAVRKEGER
jgi:ketosteroid isomerase-like protein